jgi:hypothetical protein
MDSFAAPGTHAFHAHDSQSSEPTASILCDGVKIDVSALVQFRTNALIIGDPLVVWRILSGVWPSLKKPVHWIADHRLVLPVESGGTLILEKPDRLSMREQTALLDWLHDDGRAMRVLTTSVRPLYPLVDEGLFLDALYYRLNHVLIEHDSIA